MNLKSETLSSFSQCNLLNCHLNYLIVGLNFITLFNFNYIGTNVYHMQILLLDLWKPDSLFKEYRADFCFSLLYNLLQYTNG